MTTFTLAEANALMSNGWTLRDADTAIRRYHPDLTVTISAAGGFVVAQAGVTLTDGIAANGILAALEAHDRALVLGRAWTAREAA